MGNSLPCPCLEQHRRPTDSVLVMASDGSLLQFKNGTQAKEVVAAHRGHRVVRCDSHRTVLSEPDALEVSRFYFLVPEEKAGCQKTYEEFWTVGVSKLYLPDRAAARGSREGSAPRAAWAPRLGPIQEISSSASPSIENTSASSSAAPREVPVVPS